MAKRNAKAKVSTTKSRHFLANPLVIYSAIFFVSLIISFTSVSLLFFDQVPYWFAKITTRPISADELINNAVISPNLGSRQVTALDALPTEIRDFSIDDHRVWFTFDSPELGIIKRSRLAHYGFLRVNDTQWIFTQSPTVLVPRFQEYKGMITATHPYLYAQLQSMFPDIQILPLLLNTVDNTLTQIILLILELLTAILAIVGLIISINAYRRYSVDLKRLARYGKPETVIEAIKEELDLFDYTKDRVGEIRFTAHWLVVKRHALYEAVAYDSMVWVFPQAHRSLKTKNYIGIADAHNLISYFEINTADTQRVLDRIQAKAPWAIIGLNEKVEKAWKTARPKLIEWVKQRREKQSSSEVIDKPQTNIPVTIPAPQIPVDTKPSVKLTNNRLLKILSASQYLTAFLSLIALIFALIGFNLHLPKFIGLLRETKLISTEELLSLKGSYYNVQVTAFDAVPDVGEFFSYRSRTATYVRTLSYYSLLYLNDDSYLLISTEESLNPNVLSYQGNLEAIPQDVYDKIVLPILSESPYVTILPMMLNTVPNYQWGLWLLAASIAAIMAIFGIGAFIDYELHPEKHPIMRKLARFGNIKETLQSIEEESFTQTGDIQIGKTWFIQTDFLKFEAMRFGDIVWIFLSARTIRVGSETSKSFFVNLLDRYGVTISLLQFNETEAIHFMAEIQQHAPWAFVGDDAQFALAWRKNRPEVLKEFEARKVAQREQNPVQSA